MADHDLVIRSGTVIDGGGGPSFVADIAVQGSRIVEVGQVSGGGREEIDATGRIVTPGFVDIHTHYDGQATWEETLAPSSNHGVTTVIGGNCGVGFAPCRAGDRNKLITVMEGVEDIPEIVMAAGIPWNWESFPDYLDALDARRFDIDVAMQVAHSPLRVFVMGDRGIAHEASTDLDRQRMARLVTQAVQAGAIGVSTSRSLNHRTKAGVPAPSVLTAREETLALAKGLGAAGAGVFQIISEMSEEPASEMALIEEIAKVSGRPVSFSLAETMDKPQVWRKMLDALDDIAGRGLPVRAQVFPRPIGVMMGLELSLNPIVNRPAYAAIAHLPLADRVAELRRPETKARILDEEPVPDPQPVANMLIGAVGAMYALGAHPDYMPSEAMRLDRRAMREGTTALSLAYDLMLEQDGHALLYLPSANYATGGSGPIREMLTNPNTVLGLADGGAHYGMICDAGYPTYLLSYWVKEAPADIRFPIEWAVHALSRRPAQTVGLTDRGLIACGLKADINVIDLDRLTLGAPRPSFDLPSGGRRLRQSATGYDATIVSGTIIARHDRPTGTRPGRLVRGPGHAPLALAG
ncbi:amidohydrolase family protein [Sphingomonas sp. CGMCC 1.13654]|uniref:Amidohydrolase family protein n=1 Tax=Sphingomonas chungangi TaxID=2683589 RepID=A0A838L3W6_9SPHN|nr:amidohydrolase family protein [Sphingomonas chungangi]MBA2933864.1 amidohydrolase family protein [Sphingomonas chungangi]MVW55194.1 amidohydrolase family protein [Sphingomonas chungangi]